MLEILRKGKSSIFGFIIIGFCAALMLPFGLDMINSSGNGNGAPIVVDGEEITQRQYYLRKQQIQEIFRGQFKGNFGQIQKMLNIPQKTVDDIVNSVLINNFLKKINFGAGVNQIETKIASHPYFQGQITQASFESFLRAQGLNSAALEDSTKKQIIMEQLQNIFSDVSSPSKKELNNNIEQESVLKKFKYLELKSSNFEKKVTSDEKELEEFFNENSQKYLTQRAVSFTAIPFESKQYLKSVEVDEQELMQIYESDFSQFYTPAQVKIKELVINKNRFLTTSEKPNEIEIAQSETTAKEYITNLEKKLNEGQDFVEIAAKESDEDIKTAWSIRKSLEKEIALGISSLEKGQISKIIDTPKSYKIVLFEDEKERAKKPFNSVKNIIDNKYRAENAPEYANAEAENLLNSDNFIEEAKKLGKQIIKTPNPISSGQSVTGLSTLAISKIIEMSEGDTDIINDSSSAYLVKVENVIDPEVPELKTVMDKVKRDFVAKKSVELATNKANEISERIEKGEKITEIASKDKLEVKSTEFINKNKQGISPLRDQSKRYTAFGLSNNETIVINEGPSNYILMFDESKKDADKKIDEKQIATSIKRQSGNRLFEALVNYLKSKATIDIDKSILES